VHVGIIKRVQEFVLAVGRVIRSFRESVGLSQEELAQRAGLHRTYVGSVERGERNITLVSLKRLTDVLGVAPSDVLASAERSMASSS
jgi:transcriptional regulator with XRE-family HTH domain